MNLGKKLASFVKKKSYKFGRIEAIVAAGGNELQAVVGIGKILAEKIKWTVSEEIAV